MTLGPDDLILSQYSLRGVDFGERVRVAADAGFGAIGLAAGEYLRLRDEGWTDEQFVQTLDEHGIVVDEIEALWLDGARRNEDVMWTMADLFSASHVHVLGPYEGGVTEVVAELRRIADAAAGRGVRVAIEFFPPTKVPDLRTAMEMITASGRDIGVCVDTWHHFRGAHDWDALGAVPADKVVSIQINDGAAEPELSDYFEDTLANRVAPGDGAFDLVRFVRTLDSLGVVAPYSVEVINATPPAADAAAVAALLADRTRQVLAAARVRTAG